MLIGLVVVPMLAAAVVWTIPCIEQSVYPLEGVSEEGLALVRSVPSFFQIASSLIWITIVPYIAFRLQSGSLLFKWGAAAMASTILMLADIIRWIHFWGYDTILQHYRLGGRLAVMLIFVIIGGGYAQFMSTRKHRMAPSVQIAILVTAMLFLIGTGWIAKNIPIKRKYEIMRNELVPLAHEMQYMTPEIWERMNEVQSTWTVIIDVTWCTETIELVGLQPFVANVVQYIYIDPMPEYSWLYPGHNMRYVILGSIQAIRLGVSGHERVVYMSESEDRAMLILSEDVVEIIWDTPSGVQARVYQKPEARDSEHSPAPYSVPAAGSERGEA